MKRYLLDTNLLIYSLRNDPKWDIICNTYSISNNNNFVSVVSLGEIWSLSIQNEWGNKRIEQLARISQLFIIVDINIDTIIKRYAEIDASVKGS